MEHKIGGKTAKDVFDNPLTQELAESACRGNIKKIKSLVASGADVNDSGFQGVTPLLWAISCKNEAGVEVLLKLGADPNHKAKHNYSPVTIAATYDNPALLRLVLEAGGNPDAEQGDGEGYPYETALAIAFDKGFIEEKWKNYYMLLDAGADINKESQSNETIAEIVTLSTKFCKTIELLERGYNHRLVKILHSVEISYSEDLISDAFPKAIHCREKLRKILWEKVTQEEYDAYLRRLEEHKKRVLEDDFGKNPDKKKQ